MFGDYTHTHRHTPSRATVSGTWRRNHAGKQGTWSGTWTCDTEVKVRGDGKRQEGQCQERK
jgi:hypothetical protein